MMECLALESSPPSWCENSEYAEDAPKSEVQSTVHGMRLMVPESFWIAGSFASRMFSRAHDFMTSVTVQHIIQDVARLLFGFMMLWRPVAEQKFMQWLGSSWLLRVHHPETTP